MNAGQEKGQENPLVLDDWYYTVNVCLWGCSYQIISVKSIIRRAKSNFFHRVELKTTMIHEGGRQLSGRERPRGHAVMWARVYCTKCLYSVACSAVSTFVRPEKECRAETMMHAKQVEKTSNAHRDESDGNSGKGLRKWWSKLNSLFIAFSWASQWAWGLWCSCAEESF